MSGLSERLTNLSPAKRRLLQHCLSRRPSACEPIAVVGVACRFAGAPDLESYWHLIQAGIDASSEIPDSRWNVDEFFDPTGEQPGKM